MYPILFEKDETSFSSNGLGRLRDCISCVVTEERNGIYECDFDYPVDGERYEDIICGRIIGVTHDDSDDLQPFDIVSYTKPIDGIVTFHAVHISYRQSGLTVRGTNINSLADAFNLLKNSATPTNPFTYFTDKTSTGYMASADGVPRTVRQMLGGVEGSILDAYGGEYKWDKFAVYLYAHRGEARPFTIRYGVNLLDYKDDTDYQGTYTSVIPFWKNEDQYGATQTVIGSKITADASSYTERDICVPLDLSDKYENKPTASQLQTYASSYLQQKQPYLPSQNIKVDFIRLQDMPEFEQYAPLMQCELCDTINVAFPLYEMSGTFKIVKTVWDVLEGRFIEMELGNLSTTLSEALGISQPSSGGESSGYAFVKLEGDTMTGSLTLENHDSPIGWYDGHNATTSIASGTSYSAVSGSAITLSAGRYVITASASFPGNTSGYRGIGFRSGNSNITEGSSIEATIPSTSWTTRISTSLIRNVESSETISLTLVQNSGSALSTEWYIKAIRIR